MRAHIVAALVVLSGVACQAPQSRVPERTHDKASLFADPGLVPTREGERARRELALSGELEAQLAVLPAVREVRASLSSGSEAPARLVIDIRVAHGADGPAVRERALALSALLAPEASVEAAVHAAPPDPPARDERTLPLMLAVLAVGVSAGLALERARLRRTLSR